MENGRQGESALDQAVIEAKLARRATWPVGSGRGGAQLVKYVSATFVIALIMVGITWLFAKGSEESKAICNGREMDPGDVCIFYNPQQTLNYEQMQQRAADTQSHPFAWTITVVVLVVAALVVGGEIARQFRARTPTIDELDAFMVWVNSARQDLETRVAADPRSAEAERQREVFERAVTRFARENGFRVDGSRAVLDH